MFDLGRPGLGGVSPNGTDEACLLHSGRDDSQGKAETGCDDGEPLELPQLPRVCVLIAVYVVDCGDEQDRDDNRYHELHAVHISTVRSLRYDDAPPFLWQKTNQGGAVPRQGLSNSARVTSLQKSSRTSPE